MKVKILGMTETQERQLTENSNDTGRNVVGRWMIEAPVAYSLAIVEDDGEFILERTFPGGMPSAKQLTKQINADGVLYVDEDSPADEYYIIQNDGRLAIYDEAGLFKIARKVR